MIEERCLCLAAPTQTNPLDLDSVQSIMMKAWVTEVGLSSADAKVLRAESRLYS